MGLSGLAEVEAEALDVDAARALAGDALVVDDGDTVSVAVGGVAVASAAIGDLKDAVAVDASFVDDTRLIATSDGLFSLRGDVLARSPLNDVVGGVAHLASHPGALWLATDAGLFRYGADDLVEITAGGALVASSLVAGAVVDGNLAAVAVTPAGLLAVVEKPDGLSVRELFSGVIDGVAVSAGGDVWFAAGGTLYQRFSDGRLVPRTFDSAVTGVAASPGAPGLWVATVDTLVHYDGVVFKDADLDVTAVVGGGDGDVLATGSDGGVVRVVAGRAVRFAGVVEAGLIDDGVVTSVDVVALPKRLAAAVEVSVDGAPLTAPPVALDPAALAIGAHTLSATATYPDGQVLTAERVFFAGTKQVPTWNDDVHVVYDTICSRCHDGHGGAHLLDSSDRWRGEIDRIVEALDGGIMPPGRDLPEDQRRMIRLWRATGMQE